MSQSSDDATSAPPETEAPRTGIARVAAALTHRNFRIVWLAALGSTIGTWMQNYAQSWLVFDLTHSSFYKSVDDFLAQLPILLFMLIGGVIADRHDRRKLLTGSQYVQAFSAFTLAALIFSGHVKIWHIFALSFITGCGQSFGGPAYQSMIPSLVPRRDLPNAIALNSTQFNLSRVLGPSAGSIVLLLGAGWCFALNGLSFFIVVIALMMLRLPPHVPPAPDERIRALPPAARRRAQLAVLGTELRSGLSYVRRNPVMLTLTMLVFVTTFLIMPISTLMPAFATNVLTHGPGTPASRLSMLMAAQGLGAIVGALIIGSRGRFRHMGRVLFAVQVVLGLLLAAFSQARTLPLSLMLVFMCGMFFMALFSTSFSLVQLTVPEALRGRVISIYMVALRGGWPLGGLVAGAMADRYSVPGVLMVNGSIVAIVSLVLLIAGQPRSLREI